MRANLRRPEPGLRLRWYTGHWLSPEQERQALERYFQGAPVSECLPLELMPKSHAAKAMSQLLRVREWAPAQAVRGRSRPIRSRLFFLGEVYFIQMQTPEGDGPIKIGWSFAPEERLLSLATGSPYPLVILGAFKAPADREKEVHLRFKEYQLRGEWFSAAGALLAFIAQYCDQSRYQKYKG